MKLPPSSSIFLATLAISPSSSCLAAPTGDAPQDTGVSSSSSDNHISSFYGASAAHSHPTIDSNLDQREDCMCHVFTLSILAKTNLAAALAFCDNPTIPILGVVCGLLKNLEAQNGGSQPIDPQAVESLQAAAREVSRVYNQSSVPAPVGAAIGGVAGAAPGPVGDAAGGVVKGPASTVQGPSKALSDGDDPNAGPGSSSVTSPNSAPTQTPPTAGDASSANTGSNASSSFAAGITAPTPPASPPLPQNPPNTPQPPVSPSSLPV